jgi:LysM domain
MFFLFIVYSLLVASPALAAAQNQTWTVRSGDNLEIISMTLEIPKEEIKNHNPGVLDTNLQIGQRLKLPFRSYVETNRLEGDLGKKDARISDLERKNSDLEKKIGGAELQLRWQPIWLWGFWIFFGIIAFIFSGAYWIFRQTHPRVFETPHERSIGELRESQKRVRSSFSVDEESASSRRGQWQPSLRRLPHAR